MKSITEKTGVLMVVLFATQVPFMTASFLYPFIDPNWVATVSSCPRLLQIMCFLIPPMLFLFQHNEMSIPETS